MLAMLAFCACSSNNDDDVDKQQLWNVTLTASMDDATSRALSVNGYGIIATFAENDEVVVVDADGSTIIGTLKAQTAGASTTLKGTISSFVYVNEVLTLRYRSATASYNGQVGTLEGIADHQHYAEGTLTVKTISPELTFTTTNVTLAAKQSITIFSFTDGSNAVSVKTFGIAATGLVQSIATNGTETVGAVTGTLATPSSDVYIALRNNTADKQKYYFTIQDDAGNWYTGTKSAPLENGKSYTANVTLTKLPALTSSSAVGTIGVVGGLPAIVVDLGGTIGKKAVALMNTGALCPEAYGTYNMFANRATGLSDGWYVPTSGELEALAAIDSTWGAPKGVNGRTFTIGGNTLFLPAAGLEDVINDPHDFINVSVLGCYWSSVTSDFDYLAYCLSFSASVCHIYSDYRTNGLTVRPFHELP